MEPDDSRSSARPKYLWPALFCAVGFIVLLLDGLLRGRSEFDYRMLERAQDTRLGAFDPLTSSIDLLTSPAASVAVWTAIVLLLAIGLRTWLPALAFGVLPVGWLLASSTGLIADWPAPDPGNIDAALAGTGTATVPNLHVVLPVFLYGTAFLISGRIGNLPLRIVLRTLCGGLILLAGIVQVWLGASWLLDVLASYAFGFAFVLSLGWLYLRLDRAVGGVPFIHSVEIPVDDADSSAHALTSTILFRDDKAIKIYAPGFVPRAIYWLAFQAEFPYMSNREALEAAVLRRNLAGRLTEYWYGENRVARALGIESVDGRMGLASRYIEESDEDPDPEQVDEFLHSLYDHFDEAGFPTWQIDPRQPRGKDNVLHGTDGRFYIVDLESGLVSPMASLRSWWRGIRRADFPLFDTVFYDTTRRYMESHEASMREKMGDVWYEETRDLVDRAETEKEEWHATEPRIWSRFLAALWPGFGISGLIDRAREFVDEGRDRAEEWINDATDRWREEGRISEDEAGDLRHEVSTPRFHRVLPHFGVHLTIGIFTRFPIGTILRPGYVLLNLLLATARLLLRRIDRDKWRQELSIHSPLVLLLAAAPGIGSFSYLASRPIRSNHLLIRLVLDSILVKIPYDLYQRLGWRALVARPGAEDEATTQDLPDTVVLAGIPVRPRQVGLVAIVFGAAIVVAGVIIELLSDLLEPSSWWWPDLTHLFDADTGDALLNLYQVVVVAASILVLLFLGFTLRSSKRTILAFAGVALIILAPLFDEHTPDRFGITSVFKSAVSLDFDDADYLVSLIVTTILVILSVFVAIWFLHEVPEHIRGIFLVGVVCYLGGAVAVETLRHLYGAFVSDSSFIHDALGYVEEATEIAGVVAFLYAVLEYARWSIHMRAKEAPSHES